MLAEKQLTSKWLAEQLGKSENTISKWCSNKVQPSLENLVGIAKILDVDVRELISRPLKVLLISDIQQISLRKPLINLQVFLSL